MYHYTLSGLDNVWLANGYTFKQTPYGEAVAIENADELDSIISIGLIQQQDALTAAEFRFLRQQMGMSQSDIGAFIGVDYQTVARWEKQESSLPKHADSLIRLLYSGHHAKDISVTSLIKTLNAIDKAKNSRIILKKTADTWQSELQPC